MRTLWVFLLVVTGSSVYGDETVPLPPISSDEIRLPTLPEPVGPPTPVPATILEEDEWYVIDSDLPIMVLASREGFVKITKENENLTVLGKFAGSDGKVLRKTYLGKHLYTVVAVAKGEVELLIVPIGAEDSSKVLRRTLSVMGARPPPGPGPGPGPDPTPVATHVSIAVVHDTLNISPDTAIVLNAIASWNAFVDAGNEWRHYDKDTTEANGRAAVAALGSQSLPAIVIRNKATKAVIHVGPLPKTVNELKSLIARLTGGV